MPNHLIWWGSKPRRWRIRYVHRSQYGGFRELVFGPVWFICNFDMEASVRAAIHGESVDKQEVPGV